MKSVKKNYIYNLIYQITLIIVPIISTPYVSRVLTKTGVGSVSFTQSLTQFFVIFGTLGFTYYAQREISKHQDDKHSQSVVFFEILICRVFSVIIALGVDLVFILSGVYGKNTMLMAIFTMEVISVAFDVTFIFQGNEEFGYIVLRSVLIKLVGTACIFIFIKTIDNAWIYAVINSGSVLLTALSLWPALNKKIEKVDIHELKPLRHLWPTIRLFIPTIAITLYTVLDKSLIGIITKSDAENGYYEQAEKIVKLLMVVITCLSAVMIPRQYLHGLCFYKNLTICFSILC